MRLDELFSRTSGVTVYTKTGDHLIVDKGIDGFGLRSAEIVNKLATKKEEEPSDER